MLPKGPDREKISCWAAGTLHVSFAFSCFLRKPRVLIVCFKSYSTMSKSHVFWFETRDTIKSTLICKVHDAAAFCGIFVFLFSSRGSSSLLHTQSFTKHVSHTRTHRLSSHISCIFMPTGQRAYLDVLST